MSVHVSPNTPSLPVAVIVRGLLQGLGAEDIAISGGLPLADVRRTIAELRADGRLERIVQNARDLHRQQWLEHRRG